MTPVPYDNFLPEVLPYVMGCPENVALTAIRSACIEFCEHSLYLQQALTPISVVAATAEYTVDVPAGYVLNKIMSLSLGTNPLKEVGLLDLEAMFGPAWDQRVGTPVAYLQLDAEKILLVPKPDFDQEDQLQGRISLRPTRASTTIDGVIFERWAEVIAFGARARLHDTPSQQYYDAVQAKKFRAWFESGYGDALIEINKGMTRNVQTVRMPTFV